MHSPSQTEFVYEVDQRHRRRDRSIMVYYRDHGGRLLWVRICNVRKLKDARLARVLDGRNQGQDIEIFMHAGREHINFEPAHKPELASA